MFSPHRRGGFRTCNARFSAKPDAVPFELSVFLLKFLDLEELILADIGKCLAGIGRGPPYLQIHHAGTFAKPDVLLQWRSAERASASHGSINEALTEAFIFHGYFDSGADRRAVAFHSHQAKRDPVIAVARIFKQANGVPVAGHRAPRFSDEVFLAVVFEIGKGDSVSLM